MCEHELNKVRISNYIYDTEFHCSCGYNIPYEEWLTMTEAKGICQYCTKPHGNSECMICSNPNNIRTTAIQ